MSHDNNPLPDEDNPYGLTPTRRVLIMISVMLGSTLYSTTLLVASTLLPQIQGTMAATSDEIAWMMTFNILATAVMTPMTGWLVARFGRRSVMMWSIFSFSVFTYLCGQADSLETLVLWRILQGGSGAPVVPLSQTILLDSFPRRQAGMVTAVFGMGTVLGPVIGPMLGGYLADVYSWRWAFYVIVPVGFLSFIGLRYTLPADPDLPPTKLDWTGFLSLAAAISCVQLVLSRGQRLDWFDSLEITLETVAAGLSFYIFVAHSLTTERPFLSLRLLKDRNYALGLMLVLTYGMLNFTPMVLLPPLLQAYAGFPDPLIGQVLGARGIGAVVGFFSAIFVGKLDPRIGMIIGFGVQAISGVWLCGINLNVTMTTLVANSILQGFAVGIIWVPLTVATFRTLDSRYWPEAMSVFHLMRNIGSSFFISISVAEIIRTTAQNYARMNEMLSPYNDRLAMPWVMGGWTMDTQAGLAGLAKEMNRQAAMIGYLNAFALYTAASTVGMLLVLTMTKGRKAAPQLG
jgi:DHA2 family multidrug resistance protein